MREILLNNKLHLVQFFIIKRTLVHRQNPTIYVIYFATIRTYKVR